MAKFIENGYTFDDVLLLPAKSEVLPKDVSTASNLTKDIVLNTPILSAAMDTVTEYEMAITMANAGGIGIIHKNLTIKEQTRQVAKVKKYINGYIDDPITVKKDDTLATVETILAEAKISGLPVISDNNELIGLITNRDLKYVIKDDRQVAEFMTSENLITGTKGITITEAKELMQKNKIEKLPIVDDNNKLIGYMTSKDIDNFVNYQNASKDQNGRLLCGAAIGVSEDVFERVAELIKVEVDILVLDSAHGHSQGIMEIAQKIKKLYPTIGLVVGNIVTKEAALDLAALGVDAVKVGIGPGSICTTRIISGVGRPQITAINEVAEALKDTEVCVIADGGLKYSGDIAKALAAGADVVMLGSLLAGTDQAPGEIYTLDGKLYKSYVGMGSLEAMNRGSKDRYFQGKVKNDKLISEGVSGAVSYKGDAAKVLHQLLGGVKSSMGYTGSPTIKVMQEATFQIISAATLNENHPHSILITQEQPNYKKK
ncbi:MAG: IMP dehydrogenase [Mycoplasmatales bacterium]